MELRPYDSSIDEDAGSSSIDSHLGYGDPSEQIDPEIQRRRDQVRLAMLNDELKVAPQVQPDVSDALQTEIRATNKAIGAPADGITLRPLDPEKDAVAPLTLRRYDPAQDEAPAAPAPPPEPGDEFTALRTAAATAPEQPRKIGSVVDSLPDAPRTGPPIRPEVSAAIEYQAGQNPALLARDDYIGQSARLNSPAHQARVAMLYDEAISKGAKPDAAKAWAERNAVVADDATIGPSKFDFDTAKRLQDANVLVRAGEKTLATAKQQAGGIVQAAQDVIGADSSKTAELNATYQRALDAAGEGRRGSGYLEQQLEGALVSIGTQGPQMAYAILGGPAGVTMGLGAMFMQQAGQEYTQGRQQGLSQSDALERAGFYGTAEVVGEVAGLPAAKVVAKALLASGVSTKALLPAFAKYLAAENFGEQLTTGLEFGYDKFADAGLTKDATIEDYLRAVRDTAVQTTMQTLLTGAAGKTLQHATGQARAEKAAHAAEDAKNSALAKWGQFNALVKATAKGPSTADVAAPVSAPAPEAPTVTKEQLTGIGLTEAEADQALARAEKIGREDVKNLRVFTPEEVARADRMEQEAKWRESAVETVGDRGQAVRRAATLTRETGEQHRARIVEGQWTVIKESKEEPDARAVEDAAPAADQPQAERAGGEGEPAATQAQGPKAPAAPAEGVELAAIREAAGKIRTGDAKATAAATAELDAAMERAKAAGIPQADIMRAVEGKQAVDQAAHEAATSPKNELPEPTDAQKDAGNYQKGHVNIAGLDISIENPQGSKRRPEWPTLQSHYGYIRQSEAKDGDHVDAFIKPGTPTDFSGPVFVIDQHDAQGKYDEAKVMLGFPDEVHARDAYLRNYTKGWRGLGAITEMSMDEFKSWVKDPAKTKRPAASVPVEDFKRRSDGQVKVFESEDNALRYAAQKSNRVPGNYAPRHADEGWVLSRTVKEKTAKQKAAETRRNAERTNVRPEDDLFKAMGKLGGLKASELTTDGTDRADLTPHMRTGFGRPPFRAKGGLTLDGMAEALTQHGYPFFDETGAVDQTKLREAIDEQLGGRKVYTPEGNEHWAAKSDEEKAKALDQELQAVDIATSGFDQLDEQEQEAVAAALASVGDTGDVAFEGAIPVATELTPDEFGRKVNEYLESSHAENLPAAGHPGEDRETQSSRASGGEADRASKDSPRAASGDEGVRFARAKAPQLELTGETEAQIKQREALEKQAAEDKRKKDSAPSSSDFKLTGSDRNVDVAEAHGQKPLFARAPIFESELAKQVEAIKINTGPASQWLSTLKNLKGVKADELEWSGVTDEHHAQRDPNHPFVKKNRSVQPSFDITPAMRERAMQGMPLFARLTRKDTAKGLPTFSNEEIGLAKPRLAETQPIDRTVQRIAYDIVDPDIFKAEFAKLTAAGMEVIPARQRAAAKAKVGDVLVDVRDGQFLTLYNIEFFPSVRGKGYGRKTVRSMLQSQLDPIHIRDIQPDAVDFWQKMGAQFPRSTDEMEAHLDQFHYAQKNRSASFGRDAAERAGGLRADAAGASEDGSVRSRGQQPRADLPEQVKARESGLSVSEVRAAITPVVTGWANAPDVNVIGSMADAPKAVRQTDAQQLAQDAQGRPYAFFHGGAIYLIASEIKSPQQALVGLYHEGLGHYGLRGVFGPRLESVLQSLVVARRGEVVAKAKEYGLDPLKRADLLVAAEEVLAEMAQNRPEIGFVKRAIAAIRTFLRELGVPIGRMSDDEIVRNFILPARNWVESGNSKSAMPEKEAVFARVDPNSYGEREAKLRYSGRALSERVSDLFHSDKTFGWWHRSIGTQYHKAQIDPDFKRVYDKGQDYLHEFSRAALEAADQAPHLLPKIEGLRGAVKSIVGAAKEADVKAIAKPLLDGTLQADDGNPHEGKVWSDESLRETYKLTDPQIALYREARAAIDTSLDQLLASEVATLAKNDLDDTMLESIKNDPANAGNIAGDFLAARAEAIDKEISDLLAKTMGKGEQIIGKQAEMRRLTDLATTLAEKQQNVESLKSHGYAPLMRFGKFSVSAYETDAKGVEHLAYFSLHESQSEANAVKREAQKLFPDARVVSGIKPEDSFQLYQGLTPDTLELFAQTLGLSQESVFQQYVKVAKNTRSAFKRMIHRKGMAGFEVDPTRTLAAFITSNARAVAGNWHMGDLKKAALDVPSAKGDVKDDATQLVLYLQNPREEAPMLRNYLFIQYLGGSIASAMVNMTQPLTMTYPYLAQYGAKRAGAELTVAMAQAVRPAAALDAELRAALHRGEQDGVVAPHEIHQLHAEAMRHLGSNIWIRRTLTAWGSLFSAAEAFNRRATFIAAWRIAKQDGKSDPYAFAEKAVEETQGVYNRGNRPNWSRGAIGSTIFTFRQFSISYVEFLKRLPPRERLVAMAVLFMLAGVQGLPFAEDMEDLLDTIAQALGYSFNSKQQMRQILTKALGKEGGQFVMHGASHLPGVPLDVQGRLGMGNLIPGTSMGKRSLTPEQRVKEALQVLGPVGGLIGDVSDAAQGAMAGDFAAVAKALPIVGSTAVQNVIKAVDMWQTGMYRDAKGRKVKDTTKTDAIIKAVGFQPQSVAADSKKMAEQMQNIQLHRQVESKIAQDWAEGRFEASIATNDAQKESAQKKIDAARKDLADWNEKNSDAPMRINQAQIQRRVREMRLSRDERTIKHAPREIRRSVREELSD